VFSCLKPTAKLDVVIRRATVPMVVQPGLRSSLSGMPIVADRG
jgi:hypothetical protein